MYNTAASIVTLKKANYHLPTHDACEVESEAKPSIGIMDMDRIKGSIAAEASVRRAVVTCCTAELGARTIHQRDYSSTDQSSTRLFINGLFHQRDNSSTNFFQQKNYPISARGKLKNELNWAAN